MSRVVFMTSDFVVAQDEFMGNGMGTKAFLDDGTPIVSVGCLEAAIEDGHEVFVVTTRSKLMEHDAWWLELVGRDNVFITSNGAQHEWGDERTKLFLEPWRALFAHCNVEFPEICANMWWTAFRMELRELSSGNFIPAHKLYHTGMFALDETNIRKAVGSN